MSELLALFGVHTVTLHTPGELDDYSRPTAETSEEVSGVWVDERTRTVRNANGEEILSTATVILPPDKKAAAVTAVTLPSGRRANVISYTEATSGELGLPDHNRLTLE